MSCNFLNFVCSRELLSHQESQLLFMGYKVAHNLSTANLSNLISHCCPTTLQLHCSLLFPNTLPPSSPLPFIGPSHGGLLLI